MAIDRRELLKTLKNADLILKPKLDPWFLQHGDDPVPKHIAARVAELLSERPRVRSASFSGSSAGHCERAQIFKYLGVPSGDTVDTQLANIFNDGKWRHLRLQVAMLQCGLVPDVNMIEWPVPWPAMRSMGTMDAVAVVPDDHPRPEWRGLECGVEVKGANSFAYQKLVQQGPSRYDPQYDRYFLVSGLKLLSVIAENKDTQHTTEWVVVRNEARIQRSLGELTRLNEYVDDEVLPPRLPECSKLVGDTFKRCAYGRLHGTCHAADNWEDVAP